MPNKEEQQMAPKAVKDLDRDGVITDGEIDAEIKLEKAETQMRIARIALIAMIATMFYLISPVGPEKELIEALDSSLATYFVALASIVGAYMGFSAWMSRK